MPQYQNLPEESKDSNEDDAPWLDCMDAFQQLEDNEQSETDRWQSEGRGRLFF
jgi:hypothetical protein